MAAAMFPWDLPSQRSSAATPLSSPLPFASPTPVQVSTAVMSPPPVVDLRTEAKATNVQIKVSVPWPFLFRMRKSLVKTIAYIKMVLAMANVGFLGTGEFKALPCSRDAYNANRSRSGYTPVGMTLASDEKAEAHVVEYDIEEDIPDLVRATAAGESKYDHRTKQFIRVEYIKIELCASLGEPVTCESILTLKEMSVSGHFDLMSEIPIQCYHDCASLMALPKLYSVHVDECLYGLASSLAKHPSTVEFVQRILRPWSGDFEAKTSSSSSSSSSSESTVYVIDTETKRASMLPPAGVLLWGPPGTGKTTLAKHALTRAGVRILWCGTAPELSSKWIGETEKKLKRLFYSCHQTPHLLCAIIIDEIDTLVASRSENGRSETKIDWTSIMLSLTDTTKFPNLLVIGTTNRKAALDPAFLRPPRMSEHFFLGRLGSEARRAMLMSITGVESPEVLEHAVDTTIGFTGALMEQVEKEYDKQSASPTLLASRLLRSQRHNWHVLSAEDKQKLEEDNKKVTTRGIFLAIDEVGIRAHGVDPGLDGIVSFPIAHLCSYATQVMNLSRCALAKSFLDDAVTAQSRALAFCYNDSQKSMTMWHPLGVYEEPTICGARSQFSRYPTTQEEDWCLFLRQFCRQTNTEYIIPVGARRLLGKDEKDQVLAVEELIQECRAYYELTHPCAVQQTPADECASSFTTQTSHAYLKTESKKILVVFAIDELVDMTHAHHDGSTTDKAVDHEKKTTHHHGASTSSTKSWIHPDAVHQISTMIRRLQSMKDRVIVGFRSSRPNIRDALAREIGWSDPVSCCGFATMRWSGRAHYPDAETIVHPASAHGVWMTSVDSNHLVACPTTATTQRMCYRVHISKTAAAGMEIDIGMSKVGVDPCKRLIAQVSPVQAWSLHLSSMNLSCSSVPGPRRILVSERKPVQGDVVTCIYDTSMGHGIMVFYLNSECLGLAFAGLPVDLVPAVSTYHAGDTIRSFSGAIGPPSLTGSSSVCATSMHYAPWTFWSGWGSSPPRMLLGTTTLANVDTRDTMSFCVRSAKRQTIVATCPLTIPVESDSYTEWSIASVDHKNTGWATMHIGFVTQDTAWIAEAINRCDDIGLTRGLCLKFAAGVLTGEYNCFPDKCTDKEEDKKRPMSTNVGTPAKTPVVKKTAIKPLHGVRMDDVSKLIFRHRMCVSDATTVIDIRIMTKKESTRWGSVKMPHIAYQPFISVHDAGTSFTFSHVPRVDPALNWSSDVILLSP